MTNPDQNTERLAHSPEPWKRGYRDATQIFNSPESLTAQCFQGPSIDAAKAKANAARIVACVNAMRGIPHPEEFVAECGTSEADNTALKAEVEKLQTENAKLWRTISETGERAADAENQVAIYHPTYEDQ